MSNRRKMRPREAFQCGRAVLRPCVPAVAVFFPLPQQNILADPVNSATSADGMLRRVEARKTGKWAHRTSVTPKPHTEPQGPERKECAKDRSWDTRQVTSFHSQWKDQPTRSGPLSQGWLTWQHVLRTRRVELGTDEPETLTALLWICTDVWGHCVLVFAGRSAPKWELRPICTMLFTLRYLFMPYRIPSWYVAHIWTLSSPSTLSMSR